MWAVALICPRGPVGRGRDDLLHAWTPHERQRVAEPLVTLRITLLPGSCGKWVRCRVDSHVHLGAAVDHRALQGAFLLNKSAFLGSHPGGIERAVASGKLCWVSPSFSDGMLLVIRLA